MTNLLMFNNATVPTQFNLILFYLQGGALVTICTESNFHSVNKNDWIQMYCSAHLVLYRVYLIEVRRSCKQTFFTENQIFLGLQIIKDCLIEKTTLVLHGPKAKVNLNKAKVKGTLNIDFFLI